MNEIFTVWVLICSSLMVGNELAVGLFINPLFGRLPKVSQATAAKESARIYGKVMPFWMVINLLSCLGLMFLTSGGYTAQWLTYLLAAILFAVVIVFSLIFPVPINNKIAAWDPHELPEDWLELRRQFDRYHQIRVVMLLIALVSLAFGATSQRVL
jgi:anthrone oxygenase-like protein